MVLCITVGIDCIAVHRSMTANNVRFFFWGSSQEKAFQALKDTLVNASVLAMPINGGGYVLDTDANNFLWVVFCNSGIMRS